MDRAIDYSRWKADHTSILKGLTGKTVYMLFSGGKDSSVAMDLISMAQAEFAFDLEVHAAAFPVHRYTQEERSRLDSYWGERDLHINWYDIAPSDAPVKDAANPCLPCRRLRKQHLFTGLVGSPRDWKGLVLVISHSLWDLVSYSIEYILDDLFSNREPVRDGVKSKRFMETAQRFYPLVCMKEGYTIFRPLITYNNTDILKHIERENIPTLSIPCRYADFRPKRILEKYYQKTGMDFEYDRLLEFAKKSLDLPELSHYTAMGKEEYLLHNF